MIIEKIEQTIPEAIVITIKEYPNHKPVFNLKDLMVDGKLSADVLTNKLKEWKINVDTIISTPPPKSSPTDISALKTLEGKKV